MTTLTIGLPNYGSWLGGDWALLLQLARYADDAGIHRVVVVDHLVMGNDTDAYSWGKFPTPPEAPWLEPLACLTAIAAVTTRVRLATGILIAPLRTAPVLAKTAATLDVLSQGRLDLGVGTGWQREEYDAVGRRFEDRGQLLTDTIGACRALWSDLPATFTSATMSFADVYCAPLPVQPRLPVWFGGTLNRRNLSRITTLGDGWIPIMGATLDDIRRGAEELRTATSRPIDVQSPLAVVRNEDKSPDLAATMAKIPELVAAGVTDVYLHLAALCPDPSAAGTALPAAAKAFAAATS